jgi:hypothetical protein
LKKPVGEFPQLFRGESFNFIFDFYRTHFLKLIFDEDKFNEFS